MKRIMTWHLIVTCCLSLGCKSPTPKVMLDTERAIARAQPATERWLAAHTAFDGGKFAEAKAEFREILERHVGTVGQVAPLINRYVTLMIERCDERQNSK